METVLSRLDSGAQLGSKRNAAVGKGCAPTLYNSPRDILPRYRAAIVSSVNLLIPRPTHVLPPGRRLSRGEIKLSALTGYDAGARSTEKRSLTDNAAERMEDGGRRFVERIALEQERGVLCV